MARAGRKKKQSVTIQAVGAGATVERIKRAGEDNVELIRDTKDRNAVTARMADWPLASLAKSGAIDRIQEQAGEKYNEDCYDGGLIPSSAMDYAKERVDTSVTDHTPEFKMDAQDRFNAATKAISGGPMSNPAADIVHDVCIEGIHPKDVKPHPAMRRNERDRTAATMFMLKLGLDALAVHYGMKR